ncbi:MAG: ABC transporter substrate-binding protein [Actinobacteria bacterium]|nr:ABC transporter substrate-binding protein [Actinomycetota bacterium]
MQRRRILLWLGALATTCVLAASAAAGIDEGARQEQVAFQLRIGNVLPFTGDLAAYGANLDQAAKIAVALQNESLKRLKLAGISSRLVASEDGQTQAAASVEAATKLVKVDKVHVVIGEMASGATIPVAQSVTIPNRIVQITPTSTAPQITSIKDNGYLWRILASDELQGRVLAQAAVGAFGKGATVNVGARNDAFGTALRQLFVAQYRKLGGKVGAQVSWNPTQATFDSEAGKLVAGDPKGFVMIDFPETFEKMAPALVRTGKWSPGKTLMTEAMRNADVLKKIGGPAVEGLRGTAPTSQGAPARAAFDRLFKQRAKGAKAYTGFEGSAFDAANLAFLAAVKAKSSNPVRIKGQLRAVSGPPGVKVTFRQLDKAIRLLLAGKDIDYEGAWGPTDWDRNGDPGSAVFEIWKYGGGSIATSRIITFRG